MRVVGLVAVLATAAWVAVPAPAARSPICTRGNTTVERDPRGLLPLPLSPLEPAIAAAVKFIDPKDKPFPLGASLATADIRRGPAARHECGDRVWRRTVVVLAPAAEVPAEPEPLVGCRLRRPLPARLPRLAARPLSPKKTASPEQQLERDRPVRRPLPATFCPPSTRPSLERASCGKDPARELGRVQSGGAALFDDIGGCSRDWSLERGSPLTVAPGGKEERPRTPSTSHRLFDAPGRIRTCDQRLRRPPLFH